MAEKRIVRVTSFDVAEAAGVSQSTVSRALAGDTSISEPTRKRVTEAALRLNYQVDENAARLRRGRTGTLALVMICRPGQDRKDLNPFYSRCSAAHARRPPRADTKCWSRSRTALTISGAGTRNGARPTA